jgi:hypothetical protein
MSSIRSRTRLLMNGTSFGTAREHDAAKGNQNPWGESYGGNARIDQWMTLQRLLLAFSCSGLTRPRNNRERARHVLSNVHHERRTGSTRGTSERCDAVLAYHWQCNEHRGGRCTV